MIIIPDSRINLPSVPVQIRIELLLLVCCQSVCSEEELIIVTEWNSTAKILIYWKSKGTTTIREWIRNQEILICSTLVIFLIRYLLSKEAQVGSEFRSFVTFTSETKCKWQRARGTWSSCMKSGGSPHHSGYVTWQSHHYKWGHLVDRVFSADIINGRTAIVVSIWWTKARSMKNDRIANNKVYGAAARR